MLLLKAETLARGAERWPGRRSTRTCFIGCASEKTHQSNQRVTSLPGWADWPTMTAKAEEMLKIDARPILA